MDELQRQLNPQELELLRERLRSIDGQLIAAAVFGSAARGELGADSDVDLLVVAKGLSTIEAQAHFKPAGRLLGSPINLVVFSPDAWQQACRDGNPFPKNLLARPLIALVGELRAVGKQVF